MLCSALGGLVGVCSSFQSLTHVILTFLTLDNHFFDVLTTHTCNSHSLARTRRYECPRETPRPYSQSGTFEYEYEYVFPCPLSPSIPHAH